MCISITEADAIRISMHSQQYDTLKIHMKQLAMRYDTIHPYYDAVRFDTIQHNAILRCNGKNMNAFIYLVQQTANHKLTCVFCLLTPLGLFHKTSLPNRPGLFQLV